VVKIPPSDNFSHLGLVEFEQLLRRAEVAQPLRALTLTENQLSGNMAK